MYNEGLKNLNVTKPRFNSQTNFASSLGLHYIEILLYYNFYLLEITKTNYVTLFNCVIATVLLHLNDFIIIFLKVC